VSTTAGSWATGNNMNTARRNLAGAGTQTAALAFGGFISPTTYTGATEEYDGTNWATSPGSLKQEEDSLAGSGTQTAALGFGGFNPAAAITGVTEEYDGSTWTSCRKFKHSKKLFSWLRNSNSCIRFWWLYWTCCNRSNRRI
jgi:hypothetical protein